MKKTGYSRKIISDSEINDLLDDPDLFRLEQPRGNYEHKGKFYRYVGTRYGIEYYVEIDKPEDDFDV